VEEVLNYFKENEVICKKVEDDREGYGDFIAIFGYGKLTRAEIVDCIKNNNLSVMFFEGAIRQDVWKRKNLNVINAQYDDKVCQAHRSSKMIED
jgi:hypothetical protein